MQNEVYDTIIQHFYKYVKEFYSSKKVLEKKLFWCYNILHMLFINFYEVFMREFESYEFTVHQKTYGLWIIKKIALILMYIVFVVTAFIIGVMTQIIVPFLAFVPLATWVLVFVTWRYVDVDYECEMTSGYITFSKIYGSKTRKRIFETEIKSISLIAPYTDEYFEKAVQYKPVVEYNALSSPYAEHQYFALFEDIKGKKAIFIFEANKKCLDIFRFYNSHSTVIDRSVI